MIPAGAAAEVQGLGWWYLCILGLFAAAGRVLGALILYFVGDKSEHWLLSRGKRLFGVSHEQLVHYGKRLNNSDKGWIGLFLLNAVPIFPTSMLSLACGFIRVKMRMFITATFFGTAVNALLYMGIGYAGIQAANALHDLELAFQIVTALAVATLVVWLIRRRRK